MGHRSVSVWPGPVVRISVLALGFAIGHQTTSGQEQGSPSVPTGSQAPRYLPATRAAYLQLANEVEQGLNTDLVDAWFPRSIDRQHGGFYSSFSRTWEPGQSPGKFAVFQARMTWIAAQLALRRPELKSRMLPIVRHGTAFLSNVLWDREQGGFFVGTDDQGQVTPAFGEEKHLYGMSFCVFALAAAHEATFDPRPLELAQQAFAWIDGHAHDPKNRGYFEQLTRAGQPLGTPRPGEQRRPSVFGFPPGLKSMNTHIHLLEAFAQLYRVWPDPKLKARLAELLAVVRDEICVEPGVMNLYFTPAWKAIPDHDSYGHDVETAYLMLEAEELLRRGQQPLHDPRTEAMARRLVDHALAYGFDGSLGGFFSDGTTFGRAENRNKEWWMQFEGLNALLLMHERHGAEGPRYFEAFQWQWQFIQKYQRDAEHHGFYQLVGPEGVPIATTKASIWKAAYHDGRTLLNVSEKLLSLAAAAK